MLMYFLVKVVLFVTYKHLVHSGIYLLAQCEKLSLVYFGVCLNVYA